MSKLANVCGGTKGKRWSAIGGLVLTALLLLGVLAQPAVAQEVELEDNSPRGAITHFLDLCRVGDFAGAAAFLDLPANQVADGAMRARRFKAVLDRYLWIDVDKLSVLPGGDPDDGQGSYVDQVGMLKEPGGAVAAVRITRNNGTWQFSRPTTKRVDAWFDKLPHGWIYERFPDWLLRSGPADIAYWQWFALPILVGVAWILGLLLSLLLRRILQMVTARTNSTWDEVALIKVRGPLTLACVFFTIYLLLPLLQLNQPAESFLHSAIRGALFMTLFWGLARAIDVAATVFQQASWATAGGASRSLIPLAARVVKVMVLAIAIIAFLAGLGYPVTSLVAGLGIGGLAVALAAQKTVENLFGAFSIGADQPFKEGDVVRIEDFVGTVEAIGLRSTKIRTLDRTIISYPNGRLAEMRLESLTARDRMRLACNIGLVYETTSAQMRKVLQDIEAELRAHPKIWPENIIVKFSALSSSSLDIEVMAWFQTSVWVEFQGYRQDMLLRFLEIAADAGTSLAFPTRTVHVVNDHPTS